MIVFLCFPFFFCRCDSNQLIFYDEEGEKKKKKKKRKKKEINQYDAFSLLSIKQSMFFSFLSFSLRSFVRVGYNIALDCVFLIKHLCFIISITTKPNFHCYFNFLLSIKCTHTLLGPISFSSSSFSFRVSLLCSIKNRVSRENIFTFGQCKPLI